MTESSVRRIGVATFAAFLLAVASAWHGFSFLGNPLSEAQSSGAALWLMVDLVGGVLGCVVAVIHLRHLFRSPAAPMNRTTWTLLILLLGPFAMPFYWWLHIRPASSSPLPPLPTGFIAQEQPPLVAATSVAPPNPSDTI